MIIATSVLIQHRVKLQQGATSQQGWGNCVHDDTIKYKEKSITRKDKSQDNTIEDKEIIVFTMYWK